MDFKFPNSKHLFGLPEHASSFKLHQTVDSSGTTISEPYRLFNLDVFEYDPENPLGLYGSIPFVLSPVDVSGYTGLFWMNPSDSFVDITYAEGFAKAVFLSESSALEFSVFFGNSPQSILSHYTMFCGRPILPPLFSLGYHQCRWNYESQEDVLNVNLKFEDDDIPLDVIWLDIEHTDNKRYFTWGDSFPNPTAMLEEISSYGRKMVTIVDPHIKVDPTYSVYQDAFHQGLIVKKPDGEFFEGDCWPGKSVWIDFLNPAARKFWSSCLSLEDYSGSTKDLFIWNDMNEPSVFDGPEKTMPKDLVHNNTWRHGDIHNIYGAYMHKSSHEAIMKRNESRSFVLSRSFFAGSQQFGPIWTGKFNIVVNTCFYFPRRQ